MHSTVLLYHLNVIIISIVPLDVTVSRRSPFDGMIILGGYTLVSVLISQLTCLLYTAVCIEQAQD
jgi:hypothetical protein